MVSFTFVLQNKQGLHKELAGKIVEKAITLDSEIGIKKGRKSGNAKLIFNVLGLMIKDGETVEISLNGPNEEKDAKELREFIENAIK